MEEQQVETKVVENTLPVQPQTADSEQESPQQIDWKRFKEARKIERQQKEEAEKRASEKSAEAAALKAAMESLLSKPVLHEDKSDESEEDRIQAKVDAAIAKRDKALSDQRAIAERQDLPRKLEQAYPDFNKVCSDENIDYLKFHYPEVAKAFSYVPDNFENWSDYYKTIKRFIPNASNNKDAKKAEKNFSKPQSMAVAGVTQTGDTAPMMLDDKRKADNWSRMQKRMKGI